MSSLAELFASVGYKVDEASIKKYDAALEASRAKTQAVDEQSQKLLARMADLKAARDKEAAQVRGFLSLQEELTGNQETDEEKKQRVAKAMGVVGFATKMAGEELSTSEKKARDWAKTIIALESGLNLASKAFGFVRGKIQGMLGAIGEAGGKAGSIAALSTRVGLSTDALQELGYAAEQNASDMSTLANGWKSFANKADSAAKGSKDAARAFRDVGVSAKDLRSGKLGLDDALGKVADKFKSLEDGPKKAALAMVLFGGSGGALIPLLNQGSAGIAALRAEARKLGVVLSEDGIKGLAGFDDQAAKFKTTVNALRTQALSAIIPALSKVLEKFQEWLGQNREKAVQALSAAFESLVFVIEGAAEVVGVLIDVFNVIEENKELFIGAVGGMTAALIAFKTQAIISGIAAAAAAIPAIASWTLAALPFVALGLAIAAVIKYWPRIKAGAVAAAGAIKSAFVSVKDAIVSAFTTAYNWVKEKMEAIGEFATKMINRLPNFIRSVGVGGIVGVGNTKLSSFGASNGFLPSSISVPSSASPSRSTIINSDTQINVTSNSPDPKVVATAVRSEFQNMWAGEMRKAAG